MHELAREMNDNRGPPEADRWDIFCQGRPKAYSLVCAA